MASRNVFVGRSGSFDELKRLCAPQNASHSGLSVQSVEGPGGIGKTFLLDHVLSKCDLPNQPAIVMRVDGTSGQSLREVIQALITGSKFRGKLIEGAHFPETQTILDQMVFIEEQVRKGISEEVPGDAVAMSIALDALNLVLATGETANKIFPKTAEYANCSKDNVDIVRKYMTTTFTETISIFDRLGFNSSKSLRNRIRSNAASVVSQALVEDLRRTISGKGANLKASKPRLAGASRLILIIDDYEALSPTVGHLLTDHLLPAFRHLTDFSTVAILLGRDQLKATSTEWDHHLSGALEETIVLDQLSRQELEDYFDAAGVDVDAAGRELAWNETQGYPFNVYLWLEEHKDGGQSAVMLKRFYDRTTKWMTVEREKHLEWLHAAVFMDKIDKTNWKVMLGDAEEADRALAWFESEPSIRDTQERYLTVRPYIRGRIARYIEMRDPELARQLKKKAARINKIEEDLLA